MYCKKCGAALPSHGFVCKSCGTMMDSEQIKKQKEYIKNSENDKIALNFLSDKFSKEPINRNYEKRKEYKFVGALIIVMVLFILIILALLKIV